MCADSASGVEAEVGGVLGWRAGRRRGLVEWEAVKSELDVYEQAIAYTGLQIWLSFKHTGSSVKHISVSTPRCSDS